MIVASQISCIKTQISNFFSISFNLLFEIGDEHKVAIKIQE